MEQELLNPSPKCPVCGHETYTENADDDYYNVWCTNCDWFIEVEVGEDNS